jgi:hypothetical protein
VPPPPSRRREIRSTAANAAVIRHTTATQEHEKRDQWMTRSIKRSQGFAAEEFLVSNTTCQILEGRSEENSQNLEKKQGRELTREKSRTVFILYIVYCFALSNGIIDNALGYNPAFL